jgi:hypothetical protein
MLLQLGGAINKKDVAGSLYYPTIKKTPEARKANLEHRPIKQNHPGR